MNNIKLLCLIIALPLIIHSVATKEFTKERELIETKAREREFINGKFTVLEGGFLSADDISFYWKAKYFGFIPVVVKFIPKIEGEVDYGLRECECYEALNAIKNPKVRENGITEIYFCEEMVGKKFHIIGLPPYESIEQNCEMKPKEAGQQLTDLEAVDALAFTEYAVAQVKYSHSRRVLHNNIKPTSFALINSKTYLIGWNYGERSSDIESQKSAEKKQHSWTRDVVDLFDVFLYWAKVKKNPQDASNKNRNIKDEALKHCDKIGHSILKAFCKEFHKEAYESKGKYCDYNKIHDRAAFHMRQIMRSDEETFSHWLNQIQNSKIEYYLPSKIPDPPYDGPSPLPNVRLVDQNENYPEGFLLEDIIQLEMMAKNDKHIGNKMKLVGERHMATSSSSIIWKGWWNGDIAIEFVPKTFKDSAHIEYEKNLAIEAYENPDIERFGIPNLKYYGSIFDQVHVLGFTFLESCEERLNLKLHWTHGQQISDKEALNILAMMKYSVIPMKKAHSAGQIHGNLEPDCYRLRGCQVFISKWTGKKTGEDEWESRRAVSGHQIRFIDDIETSFNVFMTFSKIKAPWINEEDEDDIIRIRNNFEGIRNRCDQIGHKVLRKYCKKFLDEAYIPQWPNYEKLFHLPDEYLKEITGSDEPVYFQWLKGKELEDAKKFKWPSLNDIPEPPHLTPLQYYNPTAPPPHITMPPSPSMSEISSQISNLRLSRSNSGNRSANSAAGHAVEDTSNSRPASSAEARASDNRPSISSGGRIASSSGSRPASSAVGQIVEDVASNRPTSSAGGASANLSPSNSGGRTEGRVGNRPANSAIGHVVEDTSNRQPAGNNDGDTTTRMRLKKILPCCCTVM